MNFFRNRNGKIIKWKAVGFFLSLLFLFIFSSQICQGLWFGDTIANGFMIAFNIILNLILSLVVYAFSAAKWLLDLMLSQDVYDKVFFSDQAITAIKEIWVVVRDFLNIFFMLIILLVAVGTILRVNKFSDKKIILNVILSALLVNFSLPIALVMIDISQLAMTFFMKGVSTEGNLFTNQIAEGINLSEIWDADLKGNMGFFLNLVFAIIFLLILTVMITILAIALIVRMVAYWVLLILSPLAMFGISMKGTGLGGEKITSDWFRKMAYYSFFGPILLFFLYISLTLARTIQELTKTAGFFTSSGLESAISFSDGLGKIVIGALSMVVPYLTVIYLLYYGYDLSKKVSTGAVNNLMGWGSKKMNQWGRSISKTIGKKSALAAGGVATLGMLPLARSSYGKGLRDRDYTITRGKYNPLSLIKTKDKRKELKEKRVRKSEARGAGKDEFSRYKREEAYNLTKKWDETGAPNTSDLKKLMKNGSDAQKKAAAIKLSKDGKLEKRSDFDLAMETVGTGKKKDKILETRIRENAKEKNVYAMIEHDINNAQTVLATRNDKKIIEEAKENTVMKKELELEEERRRTAAIGAGMVYSGMSDADKATHLKNLHATRSFKQKVYDNKVGEMGVKAILSQSPEFFDSPEALSAIRGRLTPPSTSPLSPPSTAFKREFKRAAYRDTSTSKQALLRNKGLIT